MDNEIPEINELIQQFADESKNLSLMEKIVKRQFIGLMT